MPTPRVGVRRLSPPRARMRTGADGRSYGLSQPRPALLATQSRGACRRRRLWLSPRSRASLPTVRRAASGGRGTRRGRHRLITAKPPVHGWSPWLCSPRGCARWASWPRQVAPSRRMTRAAVGGRDPVRSPDRLRRASPFSCTTRSVFGFWPRATRIGRLSGPAPCINGAPPRFVGVGPDRLLELHGSTGRRPASSTTSTSKWRRMPASSVSGSWDLWPSRWREPSGEIDPLLSCAVAAVVCWAVGGAFDFSWHLPVVGPVGGWCAGLAARAGSMRAHEEARCHHCGLATICRGRSFGWFSVLARCGDLHRDHDVVDDAGTEHPVVRIPSSSGRTPRTRRP